MPEIPKLVPFAGVCASGRRPRVRWTVTIDASQIRFVSLAEEPERESGSAHKADCRVRRIEAVGLCDAGGQICSEFRPPPLRDRRRVRRCLVALGGLFTTWHFIVVISAQQRMCQGRQGRTAREGFTRDREEHLRRPIHRPLQNCNVSGADGRPCARTGFAQRGPSRF
jgi:hypothetical protein